MIVFQAQGHCPTVLIYNCTGSVSQVRDVQQTKRSATAREVATDGHDLARSSRHDLPVWGAVENLNIRRRTDHRWISRRWSRCSTGISRVCARSASTPQAFAGARDSDAHEHREVLRRAQAADQHSRTLTASATARSGAPSEARVRQGERRRLRRAGALEPHANFNFGIASRFSRRTSTTEEHPDVGARQTLTSCSTCCGSPTHAAQTRTSRDDRLPRSRRRVQREFSRSRARGISAERQGIPVSPLRGDDRNGYKRTMPCPFSRRA